MCRPPNGWRRHEILLVRGDMAKQIRPYWCRFGNIDLRPWSLIRQKSPASKPSGKEVSGAAASEARGRKARLARKAAMSSAAHSSHPCRQRFRARVTAALLLLVSSVGAVHAQQAGDKLVIHEAYPSKNAAFWPNFVAAARGFYAKEGLDVQEVLTDPNVTVSALLGGS